MTDWRDILAEARAARETERLARFNDGWDEVSGYPVILGEEFVVGDYTYFADSEQELGKVWRRPVAYAPIPIDINAPDPLDPTLVTIDPVPVVSP